MSWVDNCRWQQKQACLRGPTDPLPRDPVRTANTNAHGTIDLDRTRETVEGQGYAGIHERGDYGDPTVQPEGKTTGSNVNPNGSSACADEGESVHGPDRGLVGRVKIAPGSLCPTSVA